MEVVRIVTARGDAISLAHGTSRARDGHRAGSPSLSPNPAHQLSLRQSSLQKSVASRTEEERKEVEELMNAALLCNEAQAPGDTAAGVSEGNTTDRAVMKAGAVLGLDILAGGEIAVATVGELCRQLHFRLRPALAP